MITLHRLINQHAANPHQRHVDIHDNNKIGGQNEFGVASEHSMRFMCPPICLSVHNNCQFPWPFQYLFN